MKKFFKSPIIKTFLWLLKKIAAYFLIGIAYMVFILGGSFLVLSIPGAVGSFLLLIALIAVLILVCIALVIMVMEKYKEFKKEDKLEEDQNE